MKLKPYLVFFLTHTHTQYSTISRKFQEVMIDYNKEEEAYRERNKQMIQRQVQLSKKQKKL